MNGSSGKQPIIGGMTRVAEPTTYNGRKYASKMEADFAEYLDLYQRGGVITSWKPQVRIVLEVPDPITGSPIAVATYILDFLVNWVDGHTEAIETKGYWTREAKLKRRLFEATWLRANPQIRFRVVTRLGPHGCPVEEEGPKSLPKAGIAHPKSMTAAQFRAWQASHA